MFHMIGRNLALVAALFGGEIMAEEKATFSGGCFWCMEAPFEELHGVSNVISGYTGGNKEDPSYEEVSSGSTKHLEAVQITFDPKQVSYDKLLQVFWRQVDPTDNGGQFVDRGKHYATAIFYHNEKQRVAAEGSKKELQESGRFTKPVVTPIIEAKPFYPAEEYHQDYHSENSLRYKLYRYNSGRDQFLEKHWEGPAVEYTEKELKERLSSLQYQVTQEDATERAFDNEYWDNKEEGIYVDIVSGEPLFSSVEKFDSRTGWPSFWQPLEDENIVEKSDYNLFYKRTELRSRIADSHLGHLFPDGPEPTGMRYCVNSASMRFIPKDKLEKEGYGKYRSLFEGEK